MDARCTATLAPAVWLVTCQLARNMEKKLPKEHSSSSSSLVPLNRLRLSIYGGCRSRITGTVTVSAMNQSCRLIGTIVKMYKPSLVACLLQIRC